MPYIQPIHFVDIPHWKPEIPDSNFKDVFSDEFTAHCDGMAKELAAPVRDDPFLLGYAMTDCPLLTEEDCRERPDVIGGAQRNARIGWPRRLRNLHKDAPGKKAYVRTMLEVYRARSAISMQPTVRSLIHSTPSRQPRTGGHILTFLMETKLVTI